VSGTNALPLAVPAASTSPLGLRPPSIRRSRSAGCRGLPGTNDRIHRNDTLVIPGSERDVPARVGGGMSMWARANRDKRKKSIPCSGLARSPLLSHPGAPCGRRAVRPPGERSPDGRTEAR
jgi:hypothetical protein